MPIFTGPCADCGTETAEICGRCDDYVCADCCKTGGGVCMTCYDELSLIERAAEPGGEHG